MLDLATLIGIGAGIFLMIWAMISGGSVREFLNLSGLAITLGGTLAATMIHYPLPRLRETFNIIRNVFRGDEEDVHSLMEQMVGYAERARREGLLALDEEADMAPDPFLRKGLGLVVDGIDPEMVRAIMERDLDALQVRHKQGAGLFETMAQYAPAFGLVGTLIGLVKMLNGIQDPAQIGPGMAVALLTTLYGALLANLIFQPIAGKLKVRSAEEILRKEAMLEGILAIQAGDGPSIIREKLNSFLAPGHRPHRKNPGLPLGEEEEYA